MFRCCGGRTGDENCFTGDYTHEKCCNLPPPPKHIKCEDAVLDPPCSTLARGYKCDKDFSGIIKDLAKGTTLGDLCRITCKRCKPPTCKEVKLAHGTAKDDGERLPGSRLTITCEKGFEQKGPKSATCDSHGIWTYSSAGSPSCKRVEKPCPHFAVPHGDVSYKDERAATKYTVAIKCRTGYLRVGPTLRTCTSKGTWEGRPPKCKPVDCGRPSIPHGRASGSTKYGGKGLRLICDGGYTKPRGKRP